MSDERPIEATPRHLQELREQGHVARSGVVTTAAVVAAVALTLVATAAAFVGRVLAFTTAVIERAFAVGVTTHERLADALRLGFDLMLELSAPVAGAAAVAALLASYVQVGPLFSVKAVAPDARRLRRSSDTPLATLPAGAELARTLAMWGLLAAIFASMLRDIVLLPRETLHAAIETCAQLSLTYAPLPVAVLVVFAVIDWVLAKARYTRASGMTRRERDDEDRQTRANPAIRTRRAEVRESRDP